MTMPRTIAGQAALSAMRPHIKRALGQVLVTIEQQASAPYLEALREADAVLERLAARDVGPDLAARAAEVHCRLAALLAAESPGDR